MAGYSKRSLAEKLGIKGGQRVYIGNAPKGYASLLGKLPEDAALVRSLDEPCDLIQFFAESRAAVRSELPRLKACLSPAGALWISWPKGASKVKTDLTENAVREIGLANGLVDIKVCAVDEVWSGLKFVYRLEDRPAC